jgi:hypothetical protein
MARSPFIGPNYRAGVLNVAVQAHGASLEVDGTVVSAPTRTITVRCSLGVANELLNFLTREDVTLAGELVDLVGAGQREINLED